jgi:hypothetical protein
LRSSFFRPSAAEEKDPDEPHVTETTVNDYLDFRVLSYAPSTNEVANRQNNAAGDALSTQLVDMYHDVMPVATFGTSQMVEVSPGVRKPECKSNSSVATGSEGANGLVSIHSKLSEYFRSKG